MSVSAGKTAANVAKGDERLGEDGRRHRVVFKAVGIDRQVSIGYDVVRASGGKSLHFETVAYDTVTDFTSPAVPASDDYESA